MELKLVPFLQEGTQMYVGTMRVDDILRVGRVDEWKDEEGTVTGYQRAPETARTGKVAQYLRSDPHPLMPTSVLLSYRGRLKTMGHGNGSVSVSIDDSDSLWIVDGQHRIFGFKRAIEELGIERLRDYALPVVIVENPSVEAEASQFRIINETMKKVRTDLARRLLAISVAARGVDGRRHMRETGRLWEATAVEIIQVLNTDDDSPWKGRIQPPNTRKLPSHVVRELSFSTSLKPLLNKMPYRNWTAERLSRVLKAYWRAWQSLAPEAFEEPQDYVLLKTPGVFSLHQLLYSVMEVLRDQNISEPDDRDFLNILGDLGVYAKEETWRADNREGAALAGSMKGFSVLADTMVDELQGAGHNI